MKKNILAAVFAVMLAGMMAGCGNQDAGEPPKDTGVQNDNAGGQNENTDELVYLADFDAGDYVTLGQYKGVEIEVSLPEVTDQSVDEYMDYVLSVHAESVPVTGRSVENGDIANIDFEGRLDGVAFEGGAAQGFDLTIGAGGFIDGFEDGVIGMEIGETKDIDLTFPDPYMYNPDLAGKDVVFTITVNSISEQVIPELTDEFVENLGIQDCTTIEDYRKFIHDGLMEQAEAAFEEEKTGAVMEAVEENTTFMTAPQGMVSRMNETLKSTVASYAQMYGMEIGDYVAAAYGSTADAYEEVLLEQAGMMAQRYIMIGAIADAEGIAIADEELEGILVDEAENFGYESVEEYREEIDVEAYREYLLVQEVIAFLTENAVVKDPVME